MNAGLTRKLLFRSSLPQRGERSERKERRGARLVQVMPVSTGKFQLFGHKEVVTLVTQTANRAAAKKRSDPSVHDT